MAANGGSNGRSTGVLDARSWRDLLIVTVIAALSIHWLPWLRWCWGLVVAYLFVRAAALVLSARAAAADPEERLEKAKASRKEGE
jgi:hypothetical protein